MQALAATFLAAKAVRAARATQTSLQQMDAAVRQVTDAVDKLMPASFRERGVRSASGLWCRELVTQRVIDTARDRFAVRAVTAVPLGCRFEYR